MGDAIGQMLASAVGIAISPVPFIAMVLMLATPHGRVNGTAFTVSWVVSVAVAVTVLVVAGTGAGAAGDGGPKSWTLWLKLGLGVLFLLLAVNQWRRRPQEGEKGRMPGWMRALDKVGPLKAAALAAALAVANPKNLVLLVAGAVSIAGSSASPGGKTVAGALMVLIASLCTLAPLAVYLAGGQSSARVLDGWKDWMSRHSSVIMTVLLLVLGAKYVGDALSGLNG